MTHVTLLDYLHDDFRHTDWQSFLITRLTETAGIHANACACRCTAAVVGEHNRRQNIVITIREREREYCRSFIADYNKAFN